MTKKRYLRILELIILISLLIGLYLVNYYSPEKNEEKIVTKITDGDTIIVEGGEIIRLLGVDCDEKGRECYNEAKNFTDTMLLNKKVVLKSENEDKDRYNRGLRWVFLDGENFNKILVEEGYCIARFDQDSRYKNEVVNAENYAISNKIGCKWQGKI
ncbi:thermonuclease family protein [Candidatus Pacearchaeota archaeon]|nr:thermonuclease family protein [Candidatus Pacearchaeota archaeon]